MVSLGELKYITMKKLILLTVGILIYSDVRSQKLIYTSTKDVILKDVTSINVSGKPTNSQTIFLSFKVSGILKGQTLTVMASDLDDGTAKKTSDYSYNTDINNKIPITLTPTDNPTNGSFTVELVKLTSKKTNAIFILNLKDKDKLDKNYKVIVNFNSTDDISTTVNS